MFLDVLMKTPLFRGIEESDLESLLGCLSAREKAYDKGETVFLAGDPAVWVGVVLEGTAQVVRDDVFGNRSILTKLSAGDLFGETFACAGTELLPVSVIAGTGCRAYLLDYRKIITSCPSSCAFHAQLVANMLWILARKNLLLNRKIEALSARSTRDKLMVYLLGLAQEARSPSFEIPFNRQELADFLAVDRSALSRELGVMREEGLLRFYKSHFELLEAWDPSL